MKAQTEEFLEVSMVADPLGVPDQLSSWILGIKAKIGGRILSNISENTDRLDRYIECVQIAQLPGAYLCCSFYQRDMNDVFTRMGIYLGAGKGLAAGTLVEHSDLTLVNYKKLVAGHNLSGELIHRFYIEAKKADGDRALSTLERTWCEAFLNSQPVQKSNDRFYVIGFAIQNMKTHQSVVTHEIFHAYYYLNEYYRDIVNRFWLDQMTVDEREQATAVVGLAYNTDVEDLVIDEFQAYLLQSGAELDRMKSLVPKLRPLLLEQLNLNGVMPILF